MDTPYSSKSLTSPLVLVTSVLSVVGWFILFIGACVAGFTGVSWWIIIFELFFMVGVIVLLGTGRFAGYRPMVYMFMAISLVYLTYLCELMVTGGMQNSGASAAAAGAVILIIMQFLWAFVLSAPEGSWLGGDVKGREVTNTITTGITSNRFSRKFMNTVQPNRTKSSHKHANSPLPERNNGIVDEEIGSTGDLSSAADDFEQATALHDYQGSPDDPQELSFEKNETIEILSKRGNWWQARKQDGTTGIVPSNYF